MAGVAGLYDYGPSGCAMEANMINIWKSHFVLEEQMLEIRASLLTPHSVLKWVMFTTINKVWDELGFLDMCYNFFKYLLQVSWSCDLRKIYYEPLFHLHNFFIYITP